MTYEHLRLEKETPTADRHRRQDKRPRFKPADPSAFGSALLENFQATKRLISTQDLVGFDDRHLLKIRLRPGERQLPAFERIEGLKVVSQEEHEVVLAFATAEAMMSVEQRLVALARDGEVTHKELLFAIQAFEQWTPEDRTGAALAEQGLVGEGPHILDVELWPQELQHHRLAALEAFKTFAMTLDAEILDEIKTESLLMVRLKCDSAAAREMLRHRDVRTVDLPPRWGLSIETVISDVNLFPSMTPPDDQSPKIAVLDTGLVPGHPLLDAAVGHAQGFVRPQYRPEDGTPWHGTSVAGLALHGDIESAITQGVFEPKVWLLSGRVFNHDGEDQTEFVENAVEKAVREFHATFECKIFNLSYGDSNKRYQGRHVRGLAYTLDRLARELGVLFVVSTGNLARSELPDDPMARYPDYLLEDHARLLDPATSLNSITVGGVARHEASHQAQQHTHSIEERPIARAGQPYPLTRSGPSVNGAIKPDFVEHAGNWAVRRLGGDTQARGLGVVTVNGGYASGGAFREVSGSSFAAPVVAHCAAKLLRRMPGASNNLLRALLGAHASWSDPAVALLNPNHSVEGRNRLLRLVGYGRIGDRALEQSLDNVVSLICEEQIGTDTCHFYHVPIPEEIWEGGRRLREITVGIAYSPAVRTTRLDYRMTKVTFNLVVANDLDQVCTAFRHRREEGITERQSGRWLTGKDRQGGTLQVSRWTFSRRPSGQVYVVVTRQDANWSTMREEPEPYALCVSIADRSIDQSQLYAQIQTILQSRVAQRLRARADVNS